MNMKRTLTPLTAAFLLFVVLGTCVVPDSKAQDTVTFVSNLSASAPDDAIISASKTVRQQFTTGSYSSGYHLTKVQLATFQLSTSDRPRVSLYSDNAGSPGTSIHVLGVPSTLHFNADNVFTASGVTLAADTNYWLVLESTSSSGEWKTDWTSWDGQNTPYGGSWSIANDYQLLEDGVVSTKNRAIVFRLQGTVDNSAATGAPTISGTAHSGEQLTAQTGAVADANGKPSSSRYRYQWVRVSGTVETDIPGAIYRQYRLTGSDAGKQVKVRFLFKDKAGYEESRTSAAHPSTGTIGNNAPTAADSTVRINEDVTHHLRRVDFKLADPDTGNSLGSVKVISLPAKGSLTNDGTAVTADQVISRGDINNRKFQYLAAENENGDGYASFEFKVSDGGAESSSAYTLTFDVAPVNDPATGDISNIILPGDFYVGLTIRTATSQIKFTIDDAEGITTEDFEYQWLRVTVDSKGNELSSTIIPGANKSYYKIRKADLGKKVRLQMSFRDDAGNLEVLQSSALFPKNEPFGLLPLLVSLFIHEGEPLEIEVANGLLNYEFHLNSNYKFWMSRREMRDHAFTVENGTIVKAKRRDRQWKFVGERLRPVGKNWVIEVKPDDPGEDVVVTHAGGRGCDEPGAICSLGRLEYLEDLAVVTITPITDIPLSVAINDTTAAEGGVASFDLQLSRKTRNVVKVVTRTTLDGTATEGQDFAAVEHVTIFNRSAVEATRTLQVGVPVHADSVADDGETVEVTIVNAQVIKNGRERIPIPITDDTAVGTIEDVTTAVVLPVISVEDASAREGEDATVDFAVSLDKASNEMVRVVYRTRSGEGTSGARTREDFVGVYDTLRFEEGETEKTIKVEIINDAVDEGSETFTLRFWGPSAATIDGVEIVATGTITNDDPLQKEWLSRFGRTVATQVVDTVTDRLSGVPTGSQVTVGGQTLDFHASRDEAVSDSQAQGASRGMSGRELLLGSSFHLAGGGGEIGGPGYAAWGRMSVDGFDGEAPADGGTMRVDGEVTTGILGADAQWERWLAGVALSVSSAEGTFDQPDVDSGTVESTLTSVNPYVRYRASDRLTAWGLLGYGTGDMTMTQAANDNRGGTVTRTDLSMRLGAVGARSVLLEAGAAGAVDLALRGDAFLVRMESEAAANTAETKADASRVRVVLEAARSFALGPGAVLAPSLELGLRHDGGDAETGTGVEVGGRISYTDTGSGLTVEANARTLVAHEDSGYREWGAGASVRLDPGASGRGLSLSLAPVWGTPSSGVDRLWSARDASALGADGEFEADSRLAIDAGYGIGLRHGRGVLTPYAGLTLGDAGARTVRTGARWRLGPDAVLGLETTRQASRAGEAGNHLMLRAALRF